MKRSYILKMLLVLLLIGSMVSITLFVALKPQSIPKTATVATASATGREDARPTEKMIPTNTTIAFPAATASSERVDGQPPACSFPLAQLATNEPQPENYAFSNPTVALTAPTHNLYNIVGWLPDNQQVLMTEDLVHNYVETNDSLIQQSSQLYNPVTGLSKIYAVHSGTGKNILMWQPALKALVYPVMNYHDLDRKAATYKLTRQIWVSHGNPKTAQILADDLPQLLVVMKPDGSEIISITEKQILRWDGALRELAPISFDLAQWDYSKNKVGIRPILYDLAWQPDTALIFLYSASGEAGANGGYDFILNAENGQICELNLGGWAQEAHWSPNGRYLAFIRSTRYSYPTYSAELTVLDTMTGKITTFDVIPQKTSENHPYRDLVLVDSFAWAPDNQHIIAAANIFANPSSKYQGLYLVDTLSGQSLNVIPTNRFNSSTATVQNIAWSSDGSKIVVRCPTTEVDKICLITVRKMAQP